MLAELLEGLAKFVHAGPVHAWLFGVVLGSPFALLVVWLGWPRRDRRAR